MIKNRVGCAVGLLLCVICYLITDSFAGSYIVAGAIFLLLTSVLLTALNGSRPAAGILTPGNCRKNQQIKGTLLLHKENAFPVFKLQVDLEIRNLLTGEVTEKKIMTALSGKKETQIDFVLESPVCGCVQVTVKSFTIYDLFGIWKKKFETDVTADILVLPDTFVTEIQMMPGMLADNESIEYSNDKAGEDISEIFGIREYLPGDSIKNIHWKLTSKYDEMMVRLPSLPLENSVLLMMETSGETADAFVYDALAEICITFSQTLLQNDISHEIAWYDHSSGMLFRFDIEQEDDLLGAIGKILSASHKHDEMKAYQHYIRESGEVGKAHIVYITQEYAEGLQQLSDEIRKTTVVCNNTGAGSDDSMTYCCTTEDYRQQLHYINI